MRLKLISLALPLALVIRCVGAQAPVAALERETLAVAPPTSAATHELRLTVAYLEGSGWTRADVLPLVRQGARILAQCGVALISAELVRIGAPARLRDYATGPARELARALPLARPTVYFVADTRQQTAFDAEAIGRANSRDRPELADTVWLTRATRDPGIAFAHELAHVLMDSGEHSEEEGNLMREDTTPRNIRLNAAQCERLRSTGAANGLLR